MKKLLHIAVIILLTGLVQVSKAQGDQNEKVMEATRLLDDYIELSGFTSGVNANSLEEFARLFTSNAQLIYDIPFKRLEYQNPEIKRISKDDRIQEEVVSLFGKTLPLNLYTKLIAREAADMGMQNKPLSPVIKYTGKRDTTRLESDTIVFEIAKSFPDSDWSVEDHSTYLVIIQFEGGKARICSIKKNEEITDEVDLLFTLVDLSSGKRSKEFRIPDLQAKFRAVFDEPINNRNFSGTSDSNGQLRFSGAVSKRTVIYLDTVINVSGMRYEIPFEWKSDGKKAMQQPAEGFMIGLRPYSWNGITYSVYFAGGITLPENVDLTHFHSESNFDQPPGYKAGLTFNLSYFFNHEKVKYDQNSWLFGLGSGVSVSYQHFASKSNAFIQSRYEYTDLNDTIAHIEFTGKDYTEKNELMAITVPLSFEMRKKTGEKFSYSIKAGVDFTLPISASYRAEGTFSRWGYYKYNDYELPITGDTRLNYFTDSIISFNDDIRYNSPLVGALLEFNGYLHIFKKNRDNSLEVGLQFMMPLTKSTSYDYSNNKYSGYWMSTENNDYRSLAYATDRLYRLYVGVKVGINFMKYRPK